MQGLYRLFKFLCTLSFRLHGREEIDFPNKVENNIHFLYPFPVYPIQCMDYDFLNKFIDDCGGEFLYPHILTNNRGEAVKIALVYVADFVKNRNTAKCVFI